MKKLVLVSDTHGNSFGFEKVLEIEKNIDMILHMGDIEGQEDYYRLIANCPFHVVAGNNDYWSDLPGENIVLVEGHRILMTHGHAYGVYDLPTGVENLRKRARECNADIVTFGHIHRPVVVEKDIKIFNPGSLTYPRQADKKCTYMVIYIAENEVKCEVKYIE